MKTEDFNRLKEICEKEGFELSLDAIEGYNQEYVFRVSKKDSWGGVEFVDISGLGIRKISLIETSLIYFLEMECDKQFGVIGKSKCKPSTEQAYIEQLKKTAYEKFGEIKGGDRFDRLLLSHGGEISIGDLINPNYQYYKEKDMFWYGNVLLYKQGKWASKLPERVKVEFKDDSWDDYGDYVEIGFVFKLPKVYDIKKGSGEFLSKQLENYLNDETNIIS